MTADPMPERIHVDRASLARLRDGDERCYRYGQIGRHEAPGSTPYIREDIYIAAVARAEAAEAEVAALRAQPEKERE